MIQGGTLGRGGEALALHLLRTDENEEVEVLPARGVAALSFRPQLREMVARTAHGRTERPIHHLHVDPETEWTEAQYVRHLELYEAEFCLSGQPRLAVFHRKHERGHRHYVWTIVRRDGSTIRMAHDYARREKYRASWNSNSASGTSLVSITAPSPLPCGERGVTMWSPAWRRRGCSMSSDRLPP
ncbi:hypothetical protein AiwAL_02930 [Acidiphilium sp. AL]|uniref:MobA/VirD2-like nuclease domain-containing protein n=1 Tax=Acidiphilium iwatense TaxID=768198 RepID=A0ABS9DWK1_9PROT|nr:MULTISPECIES: hypothetical protein [Acidiphilium]MCF3946061.1 hypothetical protein [Acidiphilium iwatense]MCU4159056.1 hypothetical protein [Acidiphilium sp. AL]